MFWKRQISKTLNTPLQFHSGREGLRGSFSTGVGLPLCETYSYISVFVLHVLKYTHTYNIYIYMYNKEKNTEEENPLVQTKLAKQTNKKPRLFRSCVVGKYITYISVSI